MKRMFSICLFLSICSCHFSIGQVSVVKDIDSRTGFEGDVENITSFGDYLFFTESSGDLEFQLYRTDGTEAGTQLAVNTQLLSGDTTERIYAITPLKTTLLLNTLGTTARFYATNGTQSGTLDLKKIAEIAVTVNDKVIFFWGDSLFEYHEKINEFTFIKKIEGSILYPTKQAVGKLNYFLVSAPLPDGPFQLYRSDGTASGTWMLAKGERMELKHVSGDTAYFAICDEIWMSTGSIGSTKLLHDFRKDMCYPDYIRTVRKYGNKLYLATLSDVSGFHLHSIDMTSTNPQIKLLNTDGWGFNSAPYNFAYINEKILFFAGKNDLYALDTKTEVVKDIAYFPGWVDLGEEWYTQSNSRIYFNGDMSTMGFEPYESDGTTEGTKILADIRYGNSSSYPKYFTMHKGELYFSAYGELGFELYKHTPSSITAIGEQPGLEKESIVEGHYDVMGRKITSPESYKGLVITRYSSGSSTKMMRQE